jgi:hypothetical protein
MATGWRMWGAGRGIDLLGHELGERNEMISGPRAPGSRLNPKRKPVTAPRGASLTESEKTVRLRDGEEVPLWFGMFKAYADRVKRHDMDSIRRSIAAGLVKERGL